MSNSFMFVGLVYWLSYCFDVSLKTICLMSFKCYFGRLWMVFANYSFSQALMFWAYKMSLGIIFFFFFANLSACYACCCCCNNNLRYLYFSFYNIFSLNFSYFALYLYSLYLYFSFSLSSFLSLVGFDYGPAILQKYFSKSFVILRNS